MAALSRSCSTGVWSTSSMRSMWLLTSWSSRALDTRADSGPNRLVASEFIASIMPIVILPVITDAAPLVRISIGPKDPAPPARSRHREEPHVQVRRASAAGRAEHLARDSARRVGRARRSLGLGQVDAAQPPLGSLQADQRRRPLRQQAAARHGPPRRAPADRYRPA